SLQRPIGLPKESTMNCPDCSAPMHQAGNHNYFRCPSCGALQFPEETGDRITMVGEPVGALCPLCQEPLVSAQIEDETVCYCNRCRGLLAEIETFGVIVTKRRSLYGPHENRTDPFDPGELKRALTCPNCQRRMDTHPYFGGGNAVVDTCNCCNLI